MRELDTPLADAAREVVVSPSWLHSLIDRNIVHGEIRGRDMWVNLDEVREYKTWIDGLTQVEKGAIRYERDAAGMAVWPVEPEPVP